MEWKMESNAQQNVAQLFEFIWLSAFKVIQNLNWSTFLDDV